MAQDLSVIAEEAKQLHTVDVYKQCLSFVDYTSLNATDTPAVAKQMAKKVNEFPSRYANIPNVAGICVYPTLVRDVYLTLHSERRVSIVSVGAGFPTSQTFYHVKKMECRMAIEACADEVDVVMALHCFLANDHYSTFSQIADIKDNNIGRCRRLKVILETGALPSLQSVRVASVGCMKASADFLKTSTGKVTPGATPEAALVMCRAIKDFYDQTEIKTGFKAAGGIATTADAVTYYAIVKHVLGEEWLRPALFRIGATSLPNRLLSDITGKEEAYF